MLPGAATRCCQCKRPLHPIPQITASSLCPVRHTCENQCHMPKAWFVRAHPAPPGTLVSRDVESTSPTLEGYVWSGGGT